MPTNTTSRTTATRTKSISYSEAIAEIEMIIAQMNSSELEIDSLGKKVKRANELIAICKEKLLKVQGDVEKILEKERK